jgi:transposase
MANRKARRGRRHDREFKMEAVRLMEERGEARSVQDVAQSLGVGTSLLYKWREVYGKDVASKKNELGETLAEENARLRDENLQLRREREVLKKSVALFIKDNQ